MKKSLLRLLMCFLVTSKCMSLNAQCPASLTISAASVTDASCPDNGSVTLAGTGVGNAAVVFKIISGPSHAGAQQSSHVFNSLSAGVYVFRASCLTQNADITITVGNIYNPINPNFSINVGDVCQYYLPGGTITITGATGGSAPLQYSFIKNSAANYDDALSVYGSANSYTAATWGTYQVRVKDACGVFVTRTINIQPLYPPATFSGASVDFADVPCDSARAWFWMKDDNGEGISLSGYPKLRFNIFEKSGSTGCAKGVLFKSIELFSGDNEVLIIPKRDMVVEIITPCGDTRVNCLDYPDNDSLQTFWQPIVNGCGTVPNPYTFSIRHLYSYLVKMPVTIKLYNNNTNTLLQTVTSTAYNHTTAFNGLPLDDYRIIVTDACNNADTVLITPPAGAVGLEPLDYGTYVDKECSYENGKVTVKLGIRGLLSNVNTSIVTITSGPDNIGATASPNAYNSRYYFYNLTPGATYGFNLDNGCTITPLTFTVPGEDWRTVTFTMNPTVSQQCGGAGTIDANIVYNGYGLRRSELWQGSTKISENNSGVYTNVLPGTYTIKGIAEMTWCANKYKEITDKVTVLSNGTVPQVLHKYAFICEDAFGMAGSTGKATIEIAGFGPFKYDIKRLSPNPQASYTNVAINAPSTYTFDNLDAYAVYSILITDNCGKSAVTEVVVSNVGALALETAGNPCVASPYLLSVQDIPGATYSWEKDGTAIQLSNTRELYFANYNASYDGKYICTVILEGACVQRTVTANISSDFCAFGLLPVKLSAFTATSLNCKIKVAFTSAEAYNGTYIIEKSTDGRSYTAISYITVLSNQLSYSITDNEAAEGVNYYRIKTVDDNGKIGYSTAVSVISNCILQNKIAVTLYPNPVVDNKATLTISSANASTATINVVNAYGQIVFSRQVGLAKGINRQFIDVTTLAKGVYVIKVADADEVLGSVKVFKQ
jgi:hypothetical protein